MAQPHSHKISGLHKSILEHVKLKRFILSFVTVLLTMASIGCESIDTEPSTPPDFCAIKADQPHHSTTVPGTINTKGWFTCNEKTVNVHAATLTIEVYQQRNGNNNWEYVKGNSRSINDVVNGLKYTVNVAIICERTKLRSRALLVYTTRYGTYKSPGHYSRTVSNLCQ